MTAVTYTNAGIQLANEGKLQQAADAFLQAIKLNPNYPEAYNNLGVIFKTANSLESAENCFRRAIKLNTKIILRLIIIWEWF